MNIVGTADSLEVDCDEDGYHLLVTTDEGDHIDVRIQSIAFEFSTSKGLLSLLEWSAEGHSVKAEHDRHAGDVDERDSLDPNDPKHPDYAENMRQRGDELRDRIRHR